MRDRAAPQRPPGRDHDRTMPRLPIRGRQGSVSTRDQQQPAWTVGSARRLAQWAHFGQRDKADKAYINHPLRVHDYVLDHPGYEALSDGDKELAEMSAWLHDAAEDTRLDVNMLTLMGAPPRLVNIVDVLTRRRSVTPEDYYAAILEDRIALIVKECDIRDNTDPHRLAALPYSVEVRLIGKYAYACAALGLPRSIMGVQP